MSINNLMNWRSDASFPVHDAKTYVVQKYGYRPTSLQQEDLARMQSRWQPVDGLLIGIPGNPRLLPPVCIELLQHAFADNFRRRMRISLILLAIASVPISIILRFNHIEWTRTVALIIGYGILLTSLAMDQFIYCATNKLLCERTRFFALFLRSRNSKASFTAALAIGLAIGGGQLIIQSRIDGYDDIIGMLAVRYDTSLLGTQWWRSFTGPLLHASVAHWFGNVALAAFIAPFAARYVGGIKTIFVFATGCAVSSFAQWKFHIAGDSFIGSSGGVFALYAVSVAALFQIRKHLPAGLWVQILCMAIASIAMSFALVNNDGTSAHLSGFFVGLVFGTQKMSRQL